MEFVPVKLSLEEARVVIREEVIATVVVWARPDSAISLGSETIMGRNVDVVNCGYQR